MKTIILCLFAIVCFCEETKPLPDSVKGDVAKFNTESEKAMVAYNRAMDKAQSDYIKSLERAQTAETRKGNLDGALAIKEELDRLKQAMEPTTDLLGNDLLQQRFLDALTKVTYGADNTWVDITEKFKADMTGSKSFINNNAALNGVLGYDPIPGPSKDVKIEYKIGTSVKVHMVRNMGKFTVADLK